MTEWLSCHLWMSLVNASGIAALTDQDEPWSTVALQIKHQPNCGLVIYEIKTNSSEFFRTIKTMKYPMERQIKFHYRRTRSTEQT